MTALPSVDLPALLLDWVEAVTASHVRSASPVGMGTSRKLWAVELVDGQQLVLRFDSGDGPVAGTPLDLAREADVYRGLSGTGVAIPNLRALHPDGSALLVERAPGQDDVLSLDADRRSAVGRDLGRKLAELHRVDPGVIDLGAAGCPEPASATAADLALWAEIARSRSGPSSSAAVGVALDSLAGTVPATARPSVCHGDAGPGNFLHDGERVTALLDWEFAHVGDPHDDLAWVVVRNQMFGRPLDLAETFGAWAEVTGAAIDVERLEWFRALVLLRMLVSCDAAIAWAGPEAPSAAAQAMLRPFLVPAMLEALRRAGLRSGAGDDLERDARGQWEGEPIAALLGDPTDLDDLGGLTCR